MSASQIAFVMHESTLVPWLTVGENLELEAKLRRCAVPVTEFNRILGALGVDISRWTKASALSLGMRQRTEIARAIAFQPELLLLDEAWSGVDSTTRKAVFSAIDEFVGTRGAAALLTTHADFDVLRLADRVYNFRDGVIRMNAECGIPRGLRIGRSQSSLLTDCDLKELIQGLDM